MTEASGVIAVGESSLALAYIKGRRGLSPRKMKLFVVGVIFAVGVPFGTVVTGSWLTAVQAVIFALGGLVIAVVTLPYISSPMTRKALAQRGQPFEMPCTLRLTPEYMVCEILDVTTTARWSCMTDVYRTKICWVFLMQSSAMVLPRRFFATEDDERAFIAEAISLMPASARDRSPDATSFIYG